MAFSSENETKNDIMNNQRGLDDRLLRMPEKSEEDEDDESNEEDEAEEDEEGRPSLRELAIAAKREREEAARALEAENPEGAEKEKTGGGFGMKKGTDSLLRRAWQLIPTTFGLAAPFAILYINIHVFLRFVLGKRFFCKLGDEWSSGAMGAVAGEAGKKAGKMAGIAEAIGLLMIDLILLCVVLAVFTLICLMFKMLTNPLDFISAIIGWAWDSIKGFVKSAVS